MDSLHSGQPPTVGSNKPSSGAKRSSEKLALPMMHTNALLSRVKKLVTMWAEEDQKNGKQVYYWNILGNQQIANIATLVPKKLD